MQPVPGPRAIKVVLTYRVLFHWRVPVFRRLSRLPNVDFLALHGADYPGTKAVNSKSLDGIRHRQLWTLRFGVRSNGELNPIPLCPTLLFHLVRERPDVILCEGGSNILNNLIVFAFAIPTRTPVVWWTLGELRGRSTRSAVQRAFDAVVRFMERRSAALLGYSSVALEYFDRMGYPKERQFRAVNCIDTAAASAKRARDASAIDALRSELGLEKKQVLLFVGAMTPAKRIEDLLVAYGRLRAARPDLRLVLVGDGPHRRFLEEFAKSAGAEDARFVGAVIDGVERYFGLGDLFVLPGLGGLAISEAMVHGLPVIATEADGCEVDLIEPGSNGDIVEVAKPEVLERAIARWIDDPAALRAAGEHSRWLIDNRYNIESYMSNVEAAIRSAAASKGN